LSVSVHFGDEALGPLVADGRLIVYSRSSTPGGHSGNADLTALAWFASSLIDPLTAAA